jgi:hypothetical protein
LPVASLREKGGSFDPTWIAFLESKVATISSFALTIAELSPIGRVLILKEERAVSFYFFGTVTSRISMI